MSGMWAASGAAGLSWSEAFESAYEHGREHDFHRAHVSRDWWPEPDHRITYGWDCPRCDLEDELRYAAEVGNPTALDGGPL